jgi:uncharacterized membrane protein
MLPLMRIKNYLFTLNLIIMDSTHVHLILNHFPIVGTLIGTLFLLFGVWKKNNSIQQISLATIFLMALFAIPVFLTGEPAEESVEKLPGVIKSLIEEHEEASQIAFWVMMVAGLFSLIGFGMQLLNNRMAKTFVTLTLLISLVTSGLMARAGYLGGQIRHTEIRSGQTLNQTNDQGSESDED